MVVKRSILINGVVTSISMEPVFWAELDLRAEQEGLPWQDYVRRIIRGLDQVPNRSSAIRESIVRLLQEDAGHQGRPRVEAWWRVRTPSDVRDVGTRGVRLFAGRGAGNDIVIDDPEVSRRHLMLSFDGSAWWAVDLESKNGMYLGRRKKALVKLRPEMTLRVGHSELTLLG